MSMPTLGNFAQAWYDALVPFQAGESDQDYQLAKFVKAVADPFEDTYDWIHGDPENDPTKVGWYILMDLDNVPEEVVRWLGQFKGVDVPIGTSLADAKLLITSADGFSRGTIEALRTKVQQVLTGTKTVTIRERYKWDDPGVDHSHYIQVITYSDETPDEALAELAAVNNTRAGLVLNFEVLDGQDWQQVINDYATWTDLIAHYPTWQDVIDDY